jgi:hypothetical protein
MIEQETIAKLKILIDPSRLIGARTLAKMIGMTPMSISNMKRNGTIDIFVTIDGREFYDKFESVKRIRSKYDWIKQTNW